MAKLLRFAIGAVVLALATPAAAETADTSHFTFRIVNPAEANFSPADTLDLTVRHWATDAERNELAAAMADGGAAALERALARLPEAGYLKWPRYIEYVVRYASMTPRSDGGHDVVLAFDRPVWLWWEKTNGAAASGSPSVTVFQLRLDKNGRGEGRMARDAASLTILPDTKTLTVHDFDHQPVVMTDVEQVRGTEDNS